MKANNIKLICIKNANTGQIIRVSKIDAVNEYHIDKRESDWTFTSKGAYKKYLNSLRPKFNAHNTTHSYKPIKNNHKLINNNRKPSKGRLEQQCIVGYDKDDNIVKPFYILTKNDKGKLVQTINPNVVDVKIKKIQHAANAVHEAANAKARFMQGDYSKCIR